jgi:hypothetical protein
MKEETKSQLDILMNKYKKKLTEPENKKEQQMSGEDIFLSEFRRLRKEVIRPAMEDIGNQLKSHGHDFEVLEEEESVDHEGRTQDANIIMRIFPAGNDKSIYRHEGTPGISFHAAKYKMKIWIHTSTVLPKRGGQAGSRGEFKPEEINTDLVEQKTLALLKEIFD